jgi:hypothetical protein
MMERRNGESSPRFKARMAGVFQPLEASTPTYGRVIHQASSHHCWQ